MLNFFYKVINGGYRLIFGDNYMLHAPLFLKENDTLFDAQRNFSDYCLTFLPSLARKRVLDVGCGNGMLSLHILEKYQPSFVYGADIVPAQIEIAKTNAAGREQQIRFGVDNAQQLATVAAHSFDVVICFESALHYPDKNLFLSEVKRVLAPGGYFLIADLLRPNDRRPGLFRKNFYLFNWSHDQYLAAFRENGLQVITDNDLNDFLLPRFKGAYRSIAKEIKEKNKPASLFFMMLARPFLNIYLFQLRNSFRYQLFTGKINDR